MNRLDDLIRDTFADDAEQAPPVAPVVARLLADQRPRRPRLTGLRPERRSGSWLATAAAAAVTATIVGVGVAILGGGGNPDASGLPSRTGLTGSGDFETRDVTYAQGSILHYGDRTIDVSPRTPGTMIQTDDGFVFLDRKGTVYFTDGEAVETIGRGVLGYGGMMLTADDSGSYVGWVEDDATAVVYDTASGREVLRERLGDGHEDATDIRVAAIDGTTAYVAASYLGDQAAGPSGTYRIDAWDLTAGTSTSIPQPRRGYFLHDVASGHRVWRDPTAGGTIVDRGPGVDQRQFPWDADNASVLSPKGTYAVTLRGTIRDLATGRDATPGSVEWGTVVQWLDDDRFVYDRGRRGYPTKGDRHDLLTCSVSAGTCDVVAHPVGGILYPDGRDFSIYVYNEQ